MIGTTMGRRWIPLVILTLGLTGCGNLRQLLGLQPGTSQAEEGAAGQQSLQVTNEGNILTNETVGIQLTLPDSWQEDARLHPASALEASDPENNLYIIVLPESDPNLRRYGLEENAATYRRILSRNLQVVEGDSRTDAFFVGERFGSQHEIRGQVREGTPVVYLHTTVLTESNYYQIVAWTTPEQYQFSRTELQTITESFREIGDP